MKNNLWKNRIVSEGTRSAKDFVFNPNNPRIHPDFQHAALRSILGEVGWVQRVVVNRTTGNLIDGELRVREAFKKSKNTLVPFVEVELSIEEERKILAVFDRITALAGTDSEKFQELLSGIEFEAPILDALFAGMQMDFENVNLDEFFEPKLAQETEDEKFPLILIFETERERNETIEGLNKIDSNAAAAVQRLLHL